MSNDIILGTAYEPFCRFAHAFDNFVRSFFASFFQSFRDGLGALFIRGEFK
jgi:hypothetical protein